MSVAGAKLSFSLGAANPSTPSAPPSNLELLMAKAKPPSRATKPTPASLFADEDEHPTQPRPNLTGHSRPASASQDKPTPKPLVSRAERRAQEEALRVDSTVFDYDGVYDGMKAAERKVEETKKAETEERKPKYIENFLASAQTRRLDRLRAEEKMLQLEREKEGDEFADKDKVVTEAYKKQMVEVRKAEEEEKQRDGESSGLVLPLEQEAQIAFLEALRKSKKGSGLSAFYKTMLDDDAEKHAAAMSASGPTTSGPSLAVKPPPKDQYEPEAEYDPLLAREEAGTSKMSAQTGKEVEVNDDGEVVDKRSLLKAGLNIMKKPKAELPTSLLSSKRGAAMLEGPYKSRAVGAAAGYQERMDRERRRLAEQVKEDAERKRLEAEEREREEEELARKRREGDDGEAEKKRQEARERFLERKRAREDGAGGAKKKAKD